jgi:hypothetical protein
LAPRQLRGALVLTLIWLGLLLAGHHLLTAAMLRLEPALKWFMAILMLIPGGFLLGIPFPLALRTLLQTPAQRAYAWSINGCASVVCAVLAAQIAISAGIPMILTVSLVAYGVALLAARTRWSPD